MEKIVQQSQPIVETTKKIGDYYIKLDTPLVGIHSNCYEIKAQPYKIVKVISTKSIKVSATELKLIIEKHFKDKFLPNQLLDYYLSPNNAYFVYNRYIHKLPEDSVSLSHYNLLLLFKKFLKLIKISKPHGNIKPYNLLYGLVRSDNIEQLFKNVFISSTGFTTFYNDVAFDVVPTTYSAPEIIVQGKIDATKISQ